jgi:hypothetical protein
MRDADNEEPLKASEIVDVEDEVKTSEMKLQPYNIDCEFEEIDNKMRKADDVEKGQRNLGIKHQRFVDE